MGVEEVDGILVVDGIITDDESVFALSRTRRLTDDDWGVDYVFDARVYVERDDGTLFPAESSNFTVWPPRYVVRNGTLDPNSRYRLRIEIDEIGTSRYLSEFSHPIITPEIDSVFWMRRAPDRPVSIHVATHSPNREVLFYQWSFREDWEINAEISFEDFPFRCWSFTYSREILLGSAEGTVFGRVIDVIREIQPFDRRLSVLYRIDVTQQAIGKRAHDYFENIRRNAEQTGSIFAPTPSSLRGNIFSDTDPSRHVIGFVSVSTTTRKRLYIPLSDGAYERPISRCPIRSHGEICEGFEGPCDPLWFGYVPFFEEFIQRRCVDCTLFGTTERPYDWPN
jgi:hypothetical protein